MALDLMTAQMQQLRRSGQWTRGPVDLLSICGLQRWELAHSAALAWLCDPEAGHGLGTKFLELLLARCGGVPDLESDIVVRTEVTRAASRADVVIESGSCIVVIEVKVDAPEGPQQCQRLFADWWDESIDTRLVFLTGSGRPPTSVTGPEVRDRWHPLTWRQVLEDLLTVEGATHEAPGGVAVADYRRTLQTRYGHAH